MLTIGGLWKYAGLKKGGRNWVFLSFSYEYITNLKFIKSSVLIIQPREGNGHLSASFHPPRAPPAIEKSSDSLSACSACICREEQHRGWTCNVYTFDFIYCWLTVLHPVFGSCCFFQSFVRHAQITWHTRARVCVHACVSFSCEPAGPARPHLTLPVHTTRATAARPGLGKPLPGAWGTASLAGQLHFSLFLTWVWHGLQCQSPSSILKPKSTYRAKWMTRPIMCSTVSVNSINMCQY